MEESPLHRLNAEQFDIVHQGQTPLIYNRSAHVERFGVVNPGLALPDEPVLKRGASERHIREMDYWTPQVTVTRGMSGKVLKRPKTFRNPGAAAPGTVSFADVTPYESGRHFSEGSGDDVYIHYINTRQDQLGQGHARRLVEHIANQYSGTLDFGRVMNPGIWKMKEELAERGRDVRGKRDF